MKKNAVGNWRVMKNLIFAGLSIWTMLLLSQALQEVMEAEIRIGMGLLLGVVIWALFAHSKNYFAYALICSGFLLAYYLAGYNHSDSTILWRIQMGGVGAFLILFMVGSLHTALEN